MIFSLVHSLPLYKFHELKIKIEFSIFDFFLLIITIFFVHYIMKMVFSKLKVYPLVPLGLIIKMTIIKSII